MSAREAMKILVVEDDAALRDALCLTLEAGDCDVLGAADGEAALRLLDGREVSLVVSDLRMSPMDGLTLLKEIRRRRPGLPVLLMTAFGEVGTAVEAMRHGAVDYLLKPFEPEVLMDLVDRHARPGEVPEGVVAGDAKTRDLLALAGRVALSEATILLTGGSGCGKEVFARYIHRRSRRTDKPFVAINCAAIPEQLLEATLFGYERGAFTGATQGQAGKFEQAQGGTLLLDEISEMPLALQAKLLRVLQEREVERVGGRGSIALDIRVIATSNRDMAAEVAAGRFREDLYYRLNVFPLHVPSLRERPGDVLPLARHFARAHGVGLDAAAVFSAAAEAKLAAHDWPGNVRELENVVQRALILSPTGRIEAEHLLFAAPPALSPAPAASPVAAVPAPSAEAETPLTVRDLERQHILDTLAAVGGSRKLAIQRLGISERTLRYKLKQYRLEGAL